MKHLFAIALMLVILGQRWEYLDGTVIDAKEWTIIRRYQLYWVIGEFVENKEWCFMGRCGGTNVERFTIPDPKTPVRIMAREQAEKANKGLMR